MRLRCKKLNIVFPVPRSAVFEFPRNMGDQLSDPAKSILEEISAIVADIDNDPESEEKKAILSKTDSEVVYGTRLLLRKVSDLRRQMGFPTVCDST